MGGQPGACILHLWAMPAGGRCYCLHQARAQMQWTSRFNRPLCPPSLACSWVEAAGGSVECPEGVEVSPLVSYAGEGLEGLCSGKTFREHFSVHLQVSGTADASS